MIDGNQWMNKWHGKTWATLGDSITHANGYQPIVQEALGFSQVANYGRGGCSMTAGGERDEGSTYRVGMGLPEKYDLITIFAGTNDFRLDKPLGAIRQIGVKQDEYTFIGAYQAVVEHLLTVNPSCRLCLWTPLHRDKDGFDIYSVNAAGYRLEDYVYAIKQLGRIYALPVLDLYMVSGINKLTLDTFTSDRLHPNEAGYARIAGIAASFLKDL
jgi:lysophospholipase L1-like esterase